MYDFASVAWAWDELWGAVHARAPWTPAELTRSGDAHARWSDPDCIVTQVCGWPFAAMHHNEMRLIGAFSLDLPEAERPAHYRSVLFSTTDTPLDELLFADIHVIANSVDSLSGWHSLRAATVGPGHVWAGSVSFTGGHRNSLAALASGDGDLACIDSWSLAFITAEEPELLRGLHRLGVGPLVPTPPITARKSLSEESVDQLRTAFADALADPSLAVAAAALRIRGFVELEFGEYLDTLPLGAGA